LAITHFQVEETPHVHWKYGRIPDQIVLFVFTLFAHENGTWFSFDDEIGENDELAVAMLKSSFTSVCDVVMPQAGLGASRAQGSTE
jgi:hypothetical protein